MLSTEMMHQRLYSICLDYESLLTPEKVMAVYRCPILVGSASDPQMYCSRSTIHSDDN